MSIENILLLILVSTSSIVFLSLSYYLVKRIQTKQTEINIDKVDKFPSYIAVLDYVMNIAYQMIYKDRILVYSMEASRIGDNELQTICRDYISLVCKLLGPNLQEEVANLFGNYDTMYFFIGQNFYTRYEDDKIRESSTEDMMNKDYLNEYTNQSS